MAASLQDIYELLKQIKEDLPSAIANSQISPSQVVILKGISELSDSLGLVQAGEFRAGNAKEPGFGFTGVRIGYPPFSYASLLWNIVGVSNDVLQFGLSAADGKAYFGGGVNVIDQYGIHVYDAGGKPALIALAAAETVNSEALGAGDVMIGDNSSTKPNLLWDQSAGKLYIRNGTTAVGQMGTSEMLNGVGASVQRGVASPQTISNTTNTLINWVTELYDEAAFFDSGSDTRITIPQTGKYQVQGKVTWNSNATGRRSIFLRKNAAVDDPVSYQAGNTQTAVNGNVTDTAFTAELSLTAADYLTLDVWQNSGGSLDTLFCYLQIRRVK